jgi:hypothetical protein
MHAPVMAPFRSISVTVVWNVPDAFDRPTLLLI